ncbi:hypothetical protein OG342_01015 [Streptomyces bobili]|uniref:hypothetical protein n=1 Tax=Streptomyces bobili TaxID=67280 RepID=UPI002251CC5A|nr:hypothetical protein [Streptomyces bobili]MCX5521470.1 hypothetical protein [Streptomyces bobili]
MVTDAEWARIRRDLRFGQVFEGTVVKIPRPGAIGIFVDIGLSVGGFVDVLLLPDEGEDWPAEGAVADFEIWWADSRQQIRLKPSDSRYPDTARPLDSPRRPHLGKRGNLGGSGSTSALVTELMPCPHHWEHDVRRLRRRVG